MSIQCKRYTVIRKSISNFTFADTKLLTLFIVHSDASRAVSWSRDVIGHPSPFSSSAMLSVSAETDGAITGNRISSTVAVYCCNGNLCHKS